LKKKLYDLWPLKKGKRSQIIAPPHATQALVKTQHF